MRTFESRARKNIYVRPIHSKMIISRIFIYVFLVTRICLSCLYLFLYVCFQPQMLAGVTALCQCSIARGGGPSLLNIHSQYLVLEFNSRNVWMVSDAAYYSLLTIILLSIPNHSLLTITFYRQHHQSAPAPLNPTGFSSPETRAHISKAGVFTTRKANQCIYKYIGLSVSV